MQIITIDLETFWSQTHSLTKMDPISYVTHPETEIISCSIKVGSGQTKVIFGEGKLRAFFASVDWSKFAVLGHNLAEFDAMILAWQFGVKPALWLDTLAMARPHYAKSVGLSLAKLAKHFGVGEKDSSALINTKGKHLEDFTEQEIADMRVYNRDDSDMCHGIFQHLREMTSAKELWVIDTTVRMLTEPRFVVDIPMLRAALSIERDRKLQDLLAVAKAVGLPPAQAEDLQEEIKTTLASAAKFAKFLEHLGVQVPTKPSPTNPENTIPALAKTDDAFVALTEHEDHRIAAAARARLSVRSTIVETRLQRFIDVAEANRGKMPIPLRYYGADTTGRWSGNMSLNMQNMPRVDDRDPANPSNAMRKCLKAPPGHKVIVSDLSGIELRVNMFLWQVPYAMELFTADPEKADLYKELAATVFGVSAPDVTTDQRRVGKAQHLGCGYMLGNPETFVTVARTMAGARITVDEARGYIKHYRQQHPQVVNGWYKCQDMLSMMLLDVETPVDPWGLVRTAKDRLVLPSGRCIYYPHLRAQDAGFWPSGDKKVAWLYGEGRHKTFIFGGKITENIVQALARDILVDNMLAYYKLTGLRPQHTVHDELIYIVPGADAQRRLDQLLQVMRTPPTWWPELAVWAEGDVAGRYGDAK